MSNRVIDRLEQRRLLAAEVFDLRTTPGSSIPSEFMNFNGIGVFQANDGIHGAELWRTDGTAAGTKLLVDLNRGIANGYSRPVAVMDGWLYFTGTDGARGLWKTDGTSQGTTLVSRTITSVYSVAVSSHRLFLSAFSESTSIGSELYITDGTPSGTRLIKDINPSGSSSPNAITAIGSRVCFVADDGVHGGELWASDGTESGTSLVMDIKPGAESSDPTGLASFQGQLYFTARPADLSTKLWRSDGTTGGTSVFFFGMDYERFTVGRAGSSLLYFNGSEPYGVSLYRTDGTLNGTFSIASSGGGFTEVNGAMFFVSSSRLFVTTGTQATTTLLKDGGVTSILAGTGNIVYFRVGAELWKSDGTVNGTMLVKTLSDLSPGSELSSPLGVNGKLIAQANVPATGQELFCSDGTSEGTGILKDIRISNADSEPLPGASLADNLLFSTSTPRRLWRINASQSNPSGLEDFSSLALPFGWVPPRDAALLNGVAVFQVSQPLLSSDVVWRSDGTVEGTFAMHSFPLGVSMDLRTFDGRIFFIGPASSLRSELWTTDGTTEGTRRFVDLLPSATSFWVDTLCAAGNRLYFTARDPDHGSELWVTDGTVDGTQILEIRPGTPSSSIGRPIAVNNEVFFSANDGVNGNELWKSDGTPAGTVLVKDINPTGSSSPTSLVNANGTLFFLADDGVNGQELWKSDGTSAGTVRVSDIVPAAGSGTPKVLVASGSIALFTADDGVHGRELWRSDGTAAGTYMLRDILPGIEGSGITSLTSTGGYVYFGANDGVHGLEVWRSDGTAAGTMLIADIFAGPSDSAPGSFLAAGDSLYFAANDLEHGRELWRLSADFVPPTVQSAFDVDANPMQVSLTFSEALASPFSAADFELMNVTTGQPVQTSMLLVSNNGLSSTIRFNTASGELPDGDYRLTIPEGSLHDTSGNALSADHVLSFFVLAADGTRDRLVDTQDFNLLATNFGGSNKVFSQGNFNYDALGKVDSEDFNLFIAQYGKKLPAPSTGAAMQGSTLFAGGPEDLSKNDLLI